MSKTDSQSSADVVVAGHICLDVIPEFHATGADLASLMVPGSLHQVGPALLTTGGAVSNTGLALHRLGIATSLMGKVGDDPFGQMIRSLLAAHDPALAAGMIVASGEQTSYTLVISPPGIDRLFFHHTGANDTYGLHDINVDRLRGAKLFHFGYPPLMRRLYSDGGAELAGIFRAARSANLATSLDMTEIDPRSDAGKVDWLSLFKKILPDVDIFLPSLDEILFAFGKKETIAAAPLLAEIAEALLGMGSAVVCLKLGDQGFYLRTTRNVDRLKKVGGSLLADARAWAGRELLSPCFSVDVVGTTGSGDCTIAGFLAGLTKNLPPDQTLTAAVATGACCCEKPDATSGVRSWDAMHERIRAGWTRRGVSLPLSGWTWNADRSIGFGPADASRK